LKRKLSPSTIWYSIICFKVVKKRVIFHSGMYEQQQEKKLRRLRYAAVALKTQMPDQKR